MKKGVTLMELILAIGIIGILAAVGFQAFHQTARKNVMDHTKEVLYTFLNAARTAERNLPNEGEPLDWTNDWKDIIGPYVRDYADISNANSPFLILPGNQQIRYFFDIHSAGSGAQFNNIPPGSRIIVAENMTTGDYRVVSWEGVETSGDIPMSPPGDPVNCAFTQDCNDQDPCTIDTCNVAAGEPTGTCLNVPMSCDDSNPCTGPDACVDGVCEYPPLSVSQSCEAGNLCKVGDHCDGAGQCEEGLTMTTCLPQVCFSPGTCDPADGICDYTNLPDGTSCGTNRVCCTGAATICCAAPPPCKIGGCNAAGNCAITGNMVNGTPCGAGGQCCGGSCCVGTCTADNKCIGFSGPGT